MKLEPCKRGETREPGQVISPPLGIGSPVWVRDEHRREYEPGKSGPTERGHWRQATIVGESARKWLLDLYDCKLPKNGKVPDGFATSPAGVERAIWTRENIHRISTAVAHLRFGATADTENVFAKLKAIAEIIDFEPKAPR